MTHEEFEFTSRYGDGPLPDPKTMCRGHCEGTGTYPHYRAGFGSASGARPAEPDETPHEHTEWTKAHREGHGLKVFLHLMWTDPVVPILNWNIAFRCDGWHFIECADCDGTGINAGMTVAK